ncbi:MAG TPA: hypothetical protein VEV17_17480 [Bryobacteraceae bacterium]|nr:hypothetical protein [Bryobacteraceae bacterium]
MFQKISRQGVHIHFQAGRKRHLGTHSGANTAQPGAFDGLMQLESIAPKRFIAEGIETENLPPLLGQLNCIIVSRILRIFRIFIRRLASESLPRDYQENRKR